MISILGQVILVIVVIIKFSGEDVESNTKGWLVALMIAPWAPVAGKVRETLSSGIRVRRMMKSRLTRNEIAAIIRDRFKFGQRGIALPSIIHHATGKVSKHPVAALKANAVLAGHIEGIRTQATLAAQTEDASALDLGALWVMNQSLQPSSIPKFRLFLWRVVSRIDPLARLWTGRAVRLAADPMPEVEDEVERARLLDVADLLQQGGTVSDELMERGMKRFCERCRLATRGAVETFLESSERGHTDLRAGKWLRDISMNWAGNFERVMDVMWEAAFIDAKAAKVGFEESDKSDAFGDRAKVTTTKMLALLFLIIRGLMAEKEMSYEVVAGIVARGPFTYEWWEKYWKRLAIRVVEAGLVDSVDSRWRSQFKATLRDVVDEDFQGIVEEFLGRPIDPLCRDDECSLSKGKITLRRHL